MGEISLYIRLVANPQCDASRELLENHVTEYLSIS